MPRPFPAPAGSVPATTPPPDSSADPRLGEAGEVVSTALSLRGIAYRNGGADPADGFDCSGFVWYVFARHGVSVPRTVGDQFAAGTRVAADALEAGDLVFFKTAGRTVSHVGVSLGGDHFIHAPSTRGVVRVERLSAVYWKERFAGARRLERADFKTGGESRFQLPASHFTLPTSPLTSHVTHQPSHFLHAAFPSFLRARASRRAREPVNWRTWRSCSVYSTGWVTGFSGSMRTVASAAGISRRSM